MNATLASNGATATASSELGAYPAASVIDGDRSGANWGSGGGWNDDTWGSYPDWVQVDFAGGKTIGEIDVFTLQDDFANAVNPTDQMTATAWGIKDFDVQYWDGSACPNRRPADINLRHHKQPNKYDRLPVRQRRKHDSRPKLERSLAKV